MVKYILKRLLQSVVTVLLVVSIVFLLLRMMPSDYFFTEDELMKFTEEMKYAKLERLGMMDICPTCGGEGTLEGGGACPACAQTEFDARGVGYVERPKLKQLGDFFMSLVEFRAFTPTMSPKAAVEEFTATVFISKDYQEKKDSSLKEIKAVNTATNAKKKVYITRTDGDGVSNKDSYLTDGVLYVKKACQILADDAEVPEGMTAFAAEADGMQRRVALVVCPDEHPEKMLIQLEAKTVQRDYAVLEEGAEPGEGEQAFDVQVGEVVRRVAVPLGEDDAFIGITVNVKQEERTVPLLRYAFAKLRGQDPFEGVPLTDASYVKAFFNLGKSMRLEKGQYVTEVIAKKLGPSMEIGLTALAIALVLGVVIGVLQAKSHAVDAVGTAYTVLVNAVPRLVIYTIIMMVGASVFGLPMRYDANSPQPWLTKVLPIFCLSVASTAGYMLWTRRYMVDELNKEYIRLARLKGLSERQVMFRHVLKNAFVPLAQYLPYSILLTVGGSLLVEKFFAVPGMGPELTNSISRYDLNLVQGIVLLYATMGIVGVFLGDLLMTLIDPRIKLTGKGDVR